MTVKRTLLSCQKEIKRKMALIFLNFNENDLFGLGGTPHPVDLSPLASYLKPAFSNVGFKLDSDFKLHQQIGAAV